MGNNVEISKALKNMVENYNDEVANFKNVSKRCVSSAKSLGEINTMIWNRCKKENIDINELNLKS